MPWVEDFFAASAATSRGSERWSTRLRDAAYWAGVEERRGEASPSEGDFASHLMHATVDGRPLTDDSCWTCSPCWSWPGSTRRAASSATCSATSPHPEDRRRLVAEPELIPSAVEEALRFYTIIFGDGRKVTRDTEFHGARSSKGDMVYGLVCGANRDPRATERAGEFVVDRKRKQPPRLRRRAAPLPRAHLAARDADRGRGVAGRDPGLPARHRRAAHGARRRRDDAAQPAAGVGRRR